MKEVWLFRLGATASILNSFVLFASGIVFVAFMPQAVNIGEFLRVFSHDPFWIQLFNSLLALGGFLGFFIISASYFFFKKENEVWTPFLLVLGIVWSFSQTFHGIWDALRMPLLSSQYLLGNEAVRTQAVAQASLPNPIDPRGFGSVFILGLWIFLLGLLMFFSKRIPRSFGYLAISSSILLTILFFGQLFLIRPLLALVIPLFSLVAGPVFWFIFAVAIWPKSIQKQSKGKSKI